MFAGSAAYRNWAMKFPQQDYFGADQGKVQTKIAPARGWQRRGFQMTPVSQPSHIPAGDQRPPFENGCSIRRTLETARKACSCAVSGARRSLKMKRDRWDSPACRGRHLLKRTRHWRRVPVREETVRRISRFAAALCVAIHTRRGTFGRAESGAIEKKPAGVTPSASLATACADPPSANQAPNVNRNCHANGLKYQTPLG